MSLWTGGVTVESNQITFIVVISKMKKVSSESELKSLLKLLKISLMLVKLNKLDFEVPTLSFESD